MKKKTGTAGTPVAPTAPVEATEADIADPGKVEEIKAEQRQTQSGKYGSIKSKPFKPPEAAGAGPAQQATTEDQKKKSWIEIELVGEDDKPVPGERYRITLPDGSVDEGTLDHNGWARLEGFEKGTCRISFPNLDQDAWKDLESTGPRAKVP